MILQCLYLLVLVSIIIQTSNGSCSLSSDTVTIFNQTIIQKDTVVNQISCFGLTDASINLTVSGGTPPYNFFWIDSVTGFNSNSEDLSNLSEGMYHCVITDSNLCPTPIISVSIIEPSLYKIVLYLTM